MSWLAEQPLLILIVGILVEAALFVALVQTGRKALLYVFLAAGLLFAGILAWERVTVTDREAVRATLYQIAAELERNDLDAVLTHVSPKAKESIAEAQRILPQVKIHEVKIKPNLEIKVRRVGDLHIADATFNVVVVVSSKSPMLADQRIPRYVEVTLHEENGRWLVRDHKDDDPLEVQRKSRPGH
jgi:hypothetical protein